MEPLSDCVSILAINSISRSRQNLITWRHVSFSPVHYCVVVKKGVVGSLLRWFPLFQVATAGYNLLHVLRVGKGRIVSVKFNVKADFEFVSLQELFANIVIHIIGQMWRFLYSNHQHGRNSPWILIFATPITTTTTTATFTNITVTSNIIINIMMIITNKKKKFHACISDLKVSVKMRQSPQL